MRMTKSEQVTGVYCGILAAEGRTVEPPEKFFLGIGYRSGRLPLSQFDDT